MRMLLRYMRQMRNGVRWRTVVYQPQLKITSNSINHVQNLSRSYGGVPAKPIISKIYNDKLLDNIDMKIQKKSRIPKDDIEQLIIEIQNSGKISNLDALLLIKSCGKFLIDVDSKESIQLVQDVWDTLISLDVKIDVSHYNALLDVYLEKDFEFSPAQFLSTMTEKLVEPNRVTFQRLIAMCCKKGDIMGATKLLEQMKNRGLPLTEEIFNLLILGHSEAGDIENAINILTIMKTAGIDPSVDTEAALMCAYAKRGDIKSLNDRIEKFKVNEMLQEVHYIDIFHTLANNGHWTQAEEFVEKMPKEIQSDIDVSRLLIKLIKMEQPDLALRLLKSTSRNPDRLNARSTLILRALVNTGTPVEVVIHVCEEIEKNLLKDRAFMFTVHCYLAAGANPSTTMKIMKAWLEAGGEIRDHFFWPLLVFEAKANNIDGIIDVLKSMINEFKINPSLRTLRDFTIPYMFGSWDNIIERLTPLNIPLNDILIAIADRFLVERKLRNAANLMTVYPIKYPKEVFLQHLVESLNAKDDVKSFVVILRFLYSDSEENSTAITDDTLREVMIVVPNYRPSVIINLLQEFTVAGLRISKEAASQVRDYLGSNVTQEVDEVIRKLESGTLKKVPMQEYNPYLLQVSDEEGVQICGNQVVELREKFAEYILKQDNERAAAVFIQLDKIGYISAPVYAQAIGVFCELENVEAAEKYMEKFTDKLPDAKLNFIKIHKYTELLIKKNRFEDAIRFLSKQPEAEPSQNLSRGIEMSVHSLLETAANHENLNNIFQLFELLRSKSLLKSENYSLGTFIKSFLNRKDNTKALEVFERAVTEYKCSPLKNQLLISMIQDNDTTNLTRCLEFCDKIYGEDDTKFSMALAHLNVGKYQLARKYFETPGLFLPNFRIKLSIDILNSMNNIMGLEELVKITKHSRANRTHLYEKLLEVYAKRNDWERGFNLWILMQEDGIRPHPNFLSKLRDLLAANNKEVPFVCEDNYRSKSIV